MASTTYQNLKTIMELSAEAGENGIQAFLQLASILSGAPSHAPAWPEFVRDGWCNCMLHVFENVSLTEPLSNEQKTLLKAMLSAELDTPLFRKFYALYFNCTFPKCANPNGILQAFGMSDATPLKNVVARIEMYAEVVEGGDCWDSQNGVCKIVSLDEANCRVKVLLADGTEKSVHIETFLDKFVLIKKDSILLKLLAKEEKMHFASRADLNAKVLDSIVTRQVADANLAKSLLVPVPYSQDEFAELCIPAPENKTAQTDESMDDLSKRWDYSRSLVELEGRLSEAIASKVKGTGKKSKSSVADEEASEDADKQNAESSLLVVSNINVQNVKNLLERNAGRADQALRWANVVGIMCRDAELQKEVTEFLSTIKNSVVSWTDAERFIEVTDKLPSKQVLPWMDITLKLAGIDFLINCTIRLPFRLWPHTERLLKELDDEQRRAAKANVADGASATTDDAEESEDKAVSKKSKKASEGKKARGENEALFVARVFDDFKAGKPSCEHYMWLWKDPVAKVSQDEASIELREKYLSDSYLLFKTLHKDLKGNYLKSQRELRKLLLDSDVFQKMVMRNGDEEAIKNLVRCVKRVPLLDSSEKQSVLVKIVRIYDSARATVEENASVQVQENIGFITSIHSYLLKQEELRKLVDEEIPANTAAIEEARSHGDLSENSEYKFAKEQQRILGQKQRELAKSLDNCRSIDFADQDVRDVVIPGCIVTLHYNDDESVEKITLLGVFDTDTEKNWFSYESPMGKVLLTKKVGTHVKTPSGREVTIAGIEALPADVLEFLRK